MPQVGIIDSAPSGAHLSHEPDKAGIMWNFKMRKEMLLPCECQLDLVRKDLLIWRWLNELLQPLPTEEELPSFSATLE